MHIQKLTLPVVNFIKERQTDGPIETSVPSQVYWQGGIVRSFNIHMVTIWQEMSKVLPIF